MQNEEKYKNALEKIAGIKSITFRDGDEAMTAMFLFQLCAKMKNIAIGALKEENLIENSSLLIEHDKHQVQD